MKTIIELTNNDIESLILNRMYKYPEYINVLNEFLTKDMFENEFLKYNCMSILTYYNKYEKIPSIAMMKKILVNLAETKKLSTRDLILTFKNAIKQDFEYDEIFIKSQIIKFLKNNVVHDAIMSELQNIQDNEDVSGCIERMEVINKITFDDDIGTDFFKKIDDIFETLCLPDNRLLTGWSELDEITNGGFPADGRCLILWAGRANIGKSLFLSNLSVNLLQQGKDVVVISCEMSEQLYATRFAAHISEIDINKLTDNVEHSKNKIKSFATKYGGNLYIKEYPPSTINTNTIKNYLEKLKLAGQNFDAIVVDYVTLLNTNNLVDNSSANSYQRVGTVCKELRALSYFMLKPVFSVCQTNRQNINDVEPDQSSIGESDQISQHSDAIFSIFQKDEDQTKGIIRTKTIKTRYGLCNTTIDFNIDYQTLRIVDATEDIFESNAEVKKTSTADELLAELDINTL